MTKTILNPFTGQLQKILEDLSELDVSVVTKTANYQVTEDDDIINVDALGGNIVITLPVTSTLKRKHKYYIKKIDGSANTVTIRGRTQ